MTPFQVTNQSSRLEVVSFSIQETGTYNTQFLRPYETDINQRTMSRVVDLANNAASLGKTVTPVSLSAVNDGVPLVNPSTRPESQIDVPNGWHERRFRFLLVVDAFSYVGGVSRYYYTGYSSHSDYTFAGTIDPRMEFMVNSVIRTNILEAMTPLHGKVTRQNFVNGRHVIANNNWGGVLADKQTYMMRPVDIYTTMQVNDLASNNFDIVNDSRQQTQRAASMSEFYDALPHDYTSKIINSYITACSTTPTFSSFNAGGGSSQFCETAAAMCIPSNENPLMLAVAAQRDFGYISNTFTIDDLNKIDPNATHVTKFFPLDQADYSLIHSAGQTSDWHGEDGITLAAIKIGQAIPALLSSFMLQTINFVSTNNTVNGVPETRVAFADGFNKEDLPRRSKAFVSRFEAELVSSFTFNNQLPYYVEVRANLLHETWIKISINGSPICDYVLPTFADSLYAPIVTNSHDRTQQLTSDFSALLSEIGSMTGVGGETELITSYL